jgi:hypothetical protein
MGLAMTVSSVVFGVTIVVGLLGYLIDRGAGRMERSHRA